MNFYFFSCLFFGYYLGKNRDEQKKNCDGPTFDLFNYVCTAKFDYFFYSWVINVSQNQILNCFLASVVTFKSSTTVINWSVYYS